MESRGSRAMRAGAAQVDITPAAGADLSGFALRDQPSVGVHDPLSARALFVSDGAAELLWLHCDLIGFDARIVRGFRDWAHRHLGLGADQVMLSATHTHSGPCTVHLQECGRYDNAYADFLQQRLETAAKLARARTEECQVAAAEGSLALAVDRRRKPSAHTDPRVGGLGFRRRDDTFLAVIVNYAIHPVALGHLNRQVSADLFAATADEVTRSLPGQPVALVTNGACGNLNPPAVNVTFEQTMDWGREIARAIIAPLAAAPTAPGTLRTRRATLAVPVETLHPAEITAFVERNGAESGHSADWGARFRRVLDGWSRHRTEALTSGSETGHREVEIFVVAMGAVRFVGVNAEVFSALADWLRRDAGRPVFVVGYANGDLGYLATEAAYAEGGYEVDSAHLFYDDFRFRRGSLEQVARFAGELLRSA
jgi:hypothetical protein